MFQVQQNVPLPKSQRGYRPGRRKYPFEDMDVGDMFFVPGKTKNTLATHASTVGKELDRKFVTRLVVMREDDGVWVMANDGAPGAIRGIGVWRTK